MNEMKNDRINIVFASDENYAQHVAVAMQSIMVNSASRDRLAFYLLADEITPATQARIRQTAEAGGASVSIVDVSAESFAHLYVSGELSRTAYFRLAMGELLPADVTRCIYLDCDLVVLADIATLWETDMEGKPLAAVPDLGILASSKDWPRKQRELGFAAGDSYFNSGMLLVDLAAWRAEQAGAEVARLAAEHRYQHHDQDALNVLFHGRFMPLPLRWNVIPPVWNLFFKILRRKDYRRAAIAARRDIAILHYAGGYKPWEYARYEAFNAHYYEYLAQTAFRDAAMPQPNPRRRGRSIQRQLRRLKLADFWQKIFEE